MSSPSRSSPTSGQPDEPAADAETGPQLAVALKYAHGIDATPVVVAKGDGSLAEQIRSIALTHGVAVRKDADLAELLMAVDVDSPIPIEAYAAVAEILSYIYRANGRLKAAGGAR